MTGPEACLASDWTWQTADGEPLTVVDSEESWFCPQCTYEAPTARQVAGHIGAKHQRKLKPIKHGTVRGYRAEKRRELQTCPACRVAWKRYYRLRRAR